MQSVSNSYLFSVVILLCDCLISHASKAVSVTKCSSIEGGVVGGVKTLESIKIDPITTNDVITSISHTKPSSANGLNNKYTLWQKQYESN